MYLKQPQVNKYTIGKVFRKLKGLRKFDETAKLIPMSEQLQEYYDELMSKGLIIKNLQYAQFTTKNKLKYCGLIASEAINSNTILMKVPVELLLTTRDAFLSDIQKVFIQNPGYYAQKFTGSWQDRIMTTFLLYEYQKGQESKWYHLIKNLPREVDYAILWSKQQIKQIQDEWMQRFIEHERCKLDEEYNELVQILKKYPQYFKESIITRKNILWLQAQIVTRCFGKSFQYTTMVPFAQLFNHQCIDVYYTMYYKPGNPYDQQQEFYQEKQLNDADAEECESSDGSYNADDFKDFQNQYLIPNEGPTWELSQQKHGVQIVKDIKSILHHMYTFINFSDSISLNYIQQIIKQLSRTVYIQPWEARKKKCKQIHSLNVKYTKKINQFYKKIKLNYYTTTITQKQKINNQGQQKQQSVPEEGVSYFNQQWPKDKFDEFYMLCSTKDQFERGSQVFFCYGRLPNKLLLTRYGIALEYNKYDHTFIRINIEQTVKYDIRFQSILKQIKINKYKRFKIKRTKMCIQLITYFRMQKWKYGENIQNIFEIKSIDEQIQVLNQTKQFYEIKLNGYKNTLIKNQQNLYNQKLGYHQYFALIYKIQQQRIICQQIKMIQYAKQVLLEIRKGFSLKDVLIKEKIPQKLTYQIMMDIYFKMFQVIQEEELQTS